MMVIAMVVMEVSGGDSRSDGDDDGVGGGRGGGGNCDGGNCDGGNGS